MSYFDKIKQDGEVVIYDKPLHWMVYVKAGAVIILLLLITAPITLRANTAAFSGVVAIIVLAIATHAVIKRYSTEIIVTDRRIIWKTGILMRNTMEMNMTKVESVDVNQSLIGRLFNYGTVVIRGTGSSYEPLSGVDAPLTLRKSIISR